MMDTYGLSSHLYAQCKDNYALFSLKETKKSYEKPQPPSIRCQVQQGKCAKF